MARSRALTPRSRRPFALISLAALLGALFAALVLPAGIAQAASYRFWGYYHLQHGSWAFAQKGPDQVTPKDGTVEGWRFALADQSTPRFPRATPSFQDVCDGTKAAGGSKRVAVVLDYGRPADGGPGAKPPAPRAQCAVVDKAASGAEVLATVAQVRTDKALVCGVDGYPRTGCGGQVKDVPAAAKAPDQPVTLAATPATPSASTSSPGSATQTQAAGGQARDAGANSDDSNSNDSNSRAATWVGSGIAILIVAALAVYTQRRRRG